MKSTAIIDKIKEHFDLRTDADVAHFLGVSRQNLYSYKQKSTEDIQALIIEKLLTVIESKQ